MKKFDEERIKYLSKANAMDTFQTLPLTLSPTLDLLDDFWISEDDIEEHPHYYLVKIPMSGVMEDTLTHTVNERTIEITGKRKHINERLKYSTAVFSCEFSLPKLADTDSIHTAVHNDDIYVVFNKRL